MARPSLIGSLEPFGSREPPFRLILIFFSGLSALADVLSVGFSGLALPEVFSALKAGEQDLPDVPGSIPDEGCAADAADGVPALMAGGKFLPGAASFSPMVCFAASAASDTFSPPFLVLTLAELSVCELMDLMKDSSVCVEESTLEETAFAYDPFARVGGLKESTSFFASMK